MTNAPLHTWKNAITFWVNKTNACAYCGTWPLLMYIMANILIKLINALHTLMTNAHMTNVFILEHALWWPSISSYDQYRHTLRKKTRLTPPSLQQYLTHIVLIHIAILFKVAGNKCVGNDDSLQQLKRKTEDMLAIEVRRLMPRRHSLHIQPAYYWVCWELPACLLHWNVSPWKTSPNQP